MIQKDANADKTNPLNKTFDLIVGHPFDVKFDDRGNVVEVTRALRPLLITSLVAFSDNPQQAEMMKKQLAGQFSDESIERQLKQYVYHLSGRESKSRFGMD